MPAFRTRALKFFLTWPQCDITLQQLVDHLKSFNPENYCGCLEAHADGSPHAHAVLQFKEQLLVTNCNHFDWNGRHANIQACRNLTKSLAYCQKDGAFESTFPESVKLSWGDMAVQAESADEYLKLVELNYPRDAALSWQRLQSYAQHKWPSVKAAAVAQLTTGWKPLPARLQLWMDDEFSRPTRPKTLFLIGPSRTGKTKWATSFGKPLYYNSSMNYREWPSTDDWTHLVLDDIPGNHIYPWKALIGSQESFVVTQKYLAQKTIKHGKPVIVCSNEDIVAKLDSRELVIWTEVNSVTIVVAAPLYEA